MTDQFWNDQARELIAVTASKLNLVREDSEQRRELLAAIIRDDLFPGKTGEREAVIAAEGSWSFSGSFEEMYPFHGPLVRRSIVATAAQILTDLDQGIPAGVNQLNSDKRVFEKYGCFMKLESVTQSIRHGCERRSLGTSCPSVAWSPAWGTVWLCCKQD